jgi:hypothetical protein
MHRRKRYCAHAVPSDGYFGQPCPARHKTIIEPNTRRSAGCSEELAKAELGAKRENCDGRHRQDDGGVRPRSTVGQRDNTMTSNTENAESRPLDDHELDLVCGGFQLIELLVQEPKQISIIMGLLPPKVEKVR